jgi:Holliday junction resolvasome RuvABC endonuclease subunit
MAKNDQENSCVLGIAPSTRGFGFAVMTVGMTLVDWGVKVVKSGKKNDKCLAQITKLIEVYQPSWIAVDDYTKNFHRGTRTQALIAELEERVRPEAVKMERFSRKQVSLEIIGGRGGTKFQVAENLANQYREQLSFRVPRKRSLWMTEPYQMDIFDAVAIARCCCRRISSYSKNKKSQSKGTEP